MRATTSGMPFGEHRNMATQGWNESFDKLAAAVAGAMQLSIPLRDNLHHDLPHF